MSEKSKEELLREKLQQYFDSKLNELTNKFQNDVNTLEKMKFNYFDNVILPFRETQKMEVLEPQEKPEKQEMPSLKKIAPKTTTTAKKNPNLERTKTPLRPTRVKDFGFKDKTVDVGKKTTKIFNATQKNTDTHKNNTKNYNTTMNNAKKEKPKTPDFSKNNRERNSKSAAKRKNIGKNKTSTLPLKTPVKNSKTKKIFEDKKPEKKEEKVEQPVVKKEIILKDKTLNKIPEIIKNNNEKALYLMLKGNYLPNDKKFKIITNNPLLYKSFDNNLKFLLEPKKQKLIAQIKEIESFFSEYNELDKYLTRAYTPSKTAINSLVFCTVQEVTNFIKKDENIPPEIANIFRLLYIIIDEDLDENLGDKELVEKFVTEVLQKHGVQDMKGLLIGYVEKHKEGILNIEKIQKIEKLIEQDKRVITSGDIMKINRPISYLTLFTKEFYEFMEAKTQNGIYYYTFVEKNRLLQKYKNELALIENEGKVINN